MQHGAGLGRGRGGGGAERGCRGSGLGEAELRSKSTNRWTGREYISFPRRVLGDIRRALTEGSATGRKSVDSRLKSNSDGHSQSHKGKEITLLGERCKVLPRDGAAR